MNQEKSQNNNTMPSSNNWKSIVEKAKELSKESEGQDWGEKTLEALREAKFD